MTGFLLDTNVPSELTRPQSDPHVEDWLDAVDDEQLFMSVVSLGEMLKGLTVLPASKRRQELQHWIDGYGSNVHTPCIIGAGAAIRFPRRAVECAGRTGSR